MGVHPHWDAEGSCQTKVSNLDAAVLVNEKVLRFHVAVENSSLVTEKDALEKLVEVALGQLRIHLFVFRDVGVHILLQVHREKLKDEIQLRLLHQNILQSHNVGVLELLQEGDLSDGGAWHALVLRLQSNLLHGNDLSCLGIPA